MITARYRSDYPGEFVVVESRWTKGKKIQKREWIANPIENQHISGRAACIGSDIDRLAFDFKKLEKHRGGLLGSKKLQTYGIASIAQHMRLDFAVGTNYNQLEELVENKYYETNVVYTTAKNCIQHPGMFYLIPNNPNLTNIALPLYLAAFDGHKEIFMLGYHNETPPENTAWMNHVENVIATYTTTKFILVGVKSVMPSRWLSYSNVQTINYRDFIGYCDV